MQCKPQEILDCKGNLGLGEVIFHLSSTDEETLVQNQSPGIL